MQERSCSGLGECMRLDTKEAGRYPGREKHSLCL